MIESRFEDKVDVLPGGETGGFREGTPEIIGSTALIGSETNFEVGSRNEIETVARWSWKTVEETIAANQAQSEAQPPLTV